jgi:hypothetical protein
MAFLVTREAAPQIAQAIADRAHFFTFELPTPADIEQINKLDQQLEADRYFLESDAAPSAEARA